MNDLEFERYSEEELCFDDPGMYTFQVKSNNSKTEIRKILSDDEFRIFIKYFKIFNEKLKNKKVIDRIISINKKYAYRLENLMTPEQKQKYGAEILLGKDFDIFEED